MKKDKLYTVNKWNQPLFARQPKNIFGLGDAMQQAGLESMKNNLVQGENLEGLKIEPGNTGGGSSNGGLNLRNIAFGGANAAATTLSPMLNKWITNGYETNGVGQTITTVGNALGDAAEAIPVFGKFLAPGVKLMSGVFGGIYNRAFGIKENKENIAAVKNNTVAAQNAAAGFNNATSTDDVLDLSRNMTSSLGLSGDDLYKGGWAKSAKRKAGRKANKLTNLENAGLAMQGVGLATGAENVMDNQYDDIMSRSFAIGGFLPMVSSTPALNTGALGLMQQNRYFDTIDKRSDALAKTNTNIGTVPNTFAGGGLKAAFLDDFTSDPLGAAIRYNQGVQQLEAQKEAAEAAQAQEAAAIEMQRRVANLETQNQGLEAQLAALNRDANYWYRTPIEESRDVVETPSAVVEEVISTPGASKASSMNKNQRATWKYIEDQLKKNGNFNAIQIEGIKRNLQRESSLDPSIVGDGGAAFGLGQWHGSRQPKDRSLEGQTKHLIDTLSAYDGKEHWVGRSNYEGFLNARTPEEAHYYIARGYERPAANILKRLERESNMSLGKLKAFGGELGTNGTDWTNGLLWINEGGTHEENPLEGVPMGVDAEGVPNLVEEGETVYNNYVFSDRLKVPQFMHKELGLGGGIKKEISFAEASKMLAKESEQRPNDPISRDGLQASLSKLAEIQEAERMKRRAEEYNNGLMYACGGKLGRKYDGTQQHSSWLKKSTQLRNAHPSEFMRKKAELDRQEALLNTLPIEQATTLGVDNVDINGWSGRVPSYSDPANYRLDAAGLHTPWGITLVSNNNVSSTSVTSPTVNTTTTSAASTASNTTAANQEAQRTAARRTADRSSNHTYDGDSRVAAAVEAAGDAYNVATDPVLQNMGITTLTPGYGIGQYWERQPKTTYEEMKETPAPWLPQSQAATVDENYNYLQRPDTESDSEDTSRGGYNPYPTWMRYAPTIGAGIMTLTDALGLTNKPDYTYADKLEAAANRAGVAPNVKYTPIGDYVAYRPMDIWFEQNRLNANARATDRAIQNNAGPLGTQMAATLANGYNSQLASGNLYRQALEYNDAKRLQAADFNRRTNMFNSQMDLESQIANARYTQAARQMGLSGLAQAAAMREAIDARLGAAKAANLNNFLTSLGNIGRENFAINQINDDDAYAYGITRKGTTPHKRSAKGKKNSRWT